MKRDAWLGSETGEAANRLDSLYVACEIVKAMASGGGGAKLSSAHLTDMLEKTYQKIEDIRKKIKT